MVWQEYIASVFVNRSMDRKIRIPLDRGIDKAAKDVYVNRLFMVTRARMTEAKGSSAVFCTETADSCRFRK